MNLPELEAKFLHEKDFNYNLTVSRQVARLYDWFAAVFIVLAGIEHRQPEFLERTECLKLLNVPVTGRRMRHAQLAARRFLD